MNISWLNKIHEIDNIYLFAGIGFILLIFYMITGKAVKSSRMTNDQKRRTLNNLRTSLVVIVIISCFVIWSKELYQTVLSLAAIGAAMAIALKEVFLCFGGSVYRTFSHPFSVGDKIQIGEIRGDVIDIGIMGTQLLEIGPKDYTHQYTGRTICIPNSLFLTTTILNETHSIHDDEKDFSLHVFIVPIRNNKKWERHRDDLLQASQKSCDQYITGANEYFTKVAKKRNVDIPWIEPRINIRFHSSTEIDLVVRVTVPVSLKGTVEQEIIRNYLAKIHTYAEL